jgi:lipoyl(octanoyl) transferase 2
MRNLIEIINLGRLDYNKSLKLQKYLVSKHLNDANNVGTEPNRLLIVEHDPVYTIGIRRQSYTDNEISKLEKLKPKPQIVFTDRGGLITFHGPGQLVAYPILNLKMFKSSLKW